MASFPLPTNLKVTRRVERTLTFAQRRARRHRSRWVEPVHILLGFGDEGTGVAAIILKNLGATSRKINKEVAKWTEVVSVAEIDPVDWSTATKKLFDLANAEAHAMGHQYLGTEHLLLALTRMPEEFASHVLANLSLSPGQIRGELLKLLA